MIQVDDIIAEARTWIGTPWHHQARVKSVGCDCIGLLVGICNELNLPIEDAQNYSTFPDGVSLARELERQFIKRNGEPQIGDILLMRISRMPQHVGILSPIGIIHSHQGVGKVVETAFPTIYRSHLISAYKFKGVL